MKVTFVSNYINHHQIPLSRALYEKLGGDYTFVQMEPMEEERIRMGWNSQQTGLPFVRCAYEQPEVCRKLILESEIVIWGGLEDETWLQPRLQAAKPVLRYSERLYKTGQWKAVSPRGLIKKYHDHTKYRKKPVYLLCAGAYVASDFHIVRAYPGKMLKWGYFPETKRYDVDKLMEGKKSRKEASGRADILWAARFIDWKHPELAVEAAGKLAESRGSFHLTMIGGGEMEAEIRSMIEEKNLQQYITLAGYKTPAEVRRAMEEADIFLMTSDRQEGWGAVLNEAMNSGCAVVADHMEGAAPYLIRQGENGFMYKSGSREQMLCCLQQLVENPGLREALGRNAYAAITEEWNAEEAAKRLLHVMKNLAEGREPERKWERGPCSKAPVIKEKFCVDKKAE